jgi:hypothetical protein
MEMEETEMTEVAAVEMAETVVAAMTEKVA